MMSLARRSFAEEQMDAAELPPAVYDQVLRDLSRVNRWTLAARPTLEFLDRAVGPRRTFSLLDVGFGSGDMLREIADWARRRGKEARLVGVDLNPKSVAVARALTPAELPIDYRTGDYTDQPEPFDFVVSSLVAHHMTPGQLRAFLRHMERTARLGWFVNDLHRRYLPHRGYPLLARMLGAHRIVREDGTLSIARSFRADEWRAILADAGVHGARVGRRFPYRLCVERLR